jgi:hypothetical protein
MLLQDTNKRRYWADVKYDIIDYLPGDTYHMSILDVTGSLLISSGAVHQTKNTLKLIDSNDHFTNQ